METKAWARQAAAVSFALATSRPAVERPRNHPDQHPVRGAFSGGRNTRRGRGGLAASREAGAAPGRRPLLRGGGRGGPGTQTRKLWSLLPHLPPHPHPCLGSQAGNPILFLCAGARRAEQRPPVWELGQLLRSGFWLLLKPCVGRQALPFSRRDYGTFALTLHLSVTSKHFTCAQCPSGWQGGQAAGRTQDPGLGLEVGVARPTGKTFAVGGRADHVFSNTVLTRVTSSLVQDLSLLSPPSLCSSCECCSKGLGPPGLPSSHHPWTQTPGAGQPPRLQGPAIHPTPTHPQARPRLCLSPPTPSLSALCRPHLADGHPLCTASLNFGAFVWEKLGRAGSCPLPPLFHLLVLPCTCILGHDPSLQRRGQQVGLSFLFFFAVD